MEEFLFNDLSYSVIRAAMEVHRLLGSGFSEKIYQKALEHELTLRQIPFARQMPIVVEYKDIKAGKYRVDLAVDGKIIVEIKAISALASAQEAQAIHYLAATRFRLALLLNFGCESLQIKRIIR
jgi:GxxExxY protein